VRSVVMCCSRYLNYIVEQDHRAIKRRCASMFPEVLSHGRRYSRRRGTRASHPQTPILLLPWHAESALLT
jgi:transposase-like protein